MQKKDLSEFALVVPPDSKLKLKRVTTDMEGPIEERWKKPGTQGRPRGWCMHGIALEWP